MKPVEDIEQYVRGWKERGRRRAHEKLERRQFAEGRLPALVAHLVDHHQARRVIVFGSLVHGFFDHTSDIDLAVEGIPGARLYRAGAELDELATPLRVDLLPLEDAYPEVREKIERTGRVLHG